MSYTDTKRLMGLREGRFFPSLGEKRLHCCSHLTLSSYVLNQREEHRQVRVSLTGTLMLCFTVTERKCRWHGIFELRCLFVSYVVGFTDRVSILLVGTTAPFLLDSPHLPLPPVHSLHPVILVSLVCFLCEYFLRDWYLNV